VQESLRIAFVPGVTPDKWARTWREREPRIPLDLVLVDEDEQESRLRDGSVDMCFVRLPVDRDGLHLIPLYEELAVVVVPVEHPVAAYDEIPLADLADEQLVAGHVDGWSELATATPLAFPEMTVRQAFEVVASGTGIAIVPMSVARLHHRKDLTHRVVTDVPPTRIGLAWRIDSDDDRLERFIGVVRGRSASSSRGRQQAGRSEGRRRRR
jgi:DNA-binding transcriptional LysR family regulator